MFLCPMLLLAEIQYSHRGYFDLGTIHRLSDGSIIKIPYRMLAYEYNRLECDEDGYCLNFNLSTAMEFRLKDIDDIFGSDLEFNLRELYLEWMTPIGDFSWGKQIITWGSASENNPTDNISPYNYYYLFSMGKERKEGILSLNSNIYLGDIKLNAIFIPQHNTNILPLNDPEFAISSPIVPKDEQIMELDNPYEYGLSVNFPFGSKDITASYFSGYDRIVSFFGANVWADKALSESFIHPDTVLSYRNIDVYGFGATGFINNIILRADLGYFITEDKIDSKENLYRDYEKGRQQIIKQCEENKEEDQTGQFPGEKICVDEPTHKETFLLDNEAKYFQTTLEVEYSPISDITIICQYSKHYVIDIGKADSLTLSTGTILLDPEQLFIPGMGSPNTFISTNALSISAQKLFSDIGLELRFTSMFDLDEKGSLYEAGIEYEIYENPKILIAVNKIIADNSIKMNPFSGMEDFSHFRFELKSYY